MIAVHCEQINTDMRVMRKSGLGYAALTSPSGGKFCSFCSFAIFALAQKLFLLLSSYKLQKWFFRQHFVRHVIMLNVKYDINADVQSRSFVKYVHSFANICTS